MTVRHLIGACVLLLIVSAPALPQTPSASFEQLIAADAIHAHQTVYVTDLWGQRVKGRLVDRIHVSPVLGRRRAGALATIRF